MMPIWQKFHRNAERFLECDDNCYITTIKKKTGFDFSGCHLDCGVFAESKYLLNVIN